MDNRADERAGTKGESPGRSPSRSAGQFPLCVWCARTNAIGSGVLCQGDNRRSRVEGFKSERVKESKRRGSGRWSDDPIERGEGRSSHDPSTALGMTSEGEARLAGRRDDSYEEREAQEPTRKTDPSIFLRASVRGTQLRLSALARATRRSGICACFVWSPKPSTPPKRPPFPQPATANSPGERIAIS